MFLAAILAAWLGRISWFWPALYVSGPVLAIWVALGRVGQPRKAVFILSSLPMFLVDLFATAAATLASLGGCGRSGSPRGSADVQPASFATDAAPLKASPPAKRSTPAGVLSG